MDEAVSVPELLADMLAWESKALAHIATIGPDGGTLNQATRRYESTIVVYAVPTQ